MPNYTLPLTVACLHFRALYWNFPASLIITTLLVYTGLVLFAKYGQADPVGCSIGRRDQVSMGHWLVGCIDPNGNVL